MGTSKPLSHSEKGLLSMLRFNFIYKVYQWLVGDHKIYNYFLSPVNELGKKRRLKILDIGCGNGNILNYIKGDYEYLGLDFNEKYIEAGRKEKSSTSVKFKVVDFTKKNLKLEGKFDIVLAAGLFHHINNEVLVNIFEEVKKRMKPETIFLSIDPTYTAGQNLIQKFIISSDRGKSIRTSDQLKEQQSGYFSRISHKIEHNLGNIPFTYLITKCKL